MSSFKVSVKDSYDLQFYLHQLKELIENRHTNDVVNQYTDVLTIAFHVVGSIPMEEGDNYVSQAKKLMKEYKKRYKQ